MEIGVLGAINANVLRMHTHIYEKLHIGHATNFNYLSFTKAKCVCSIQPTILQLKRIEFKWKEIKFYRNEKKWQIQKEKNYTIQ